jgi:signal transduction histidine kinase/CheY-like chemotaxis protein
LQIIQGLRPNALIASALALPIVLLVVLQIVFTLEREREDVERFALARAERVMSLADAQVQADVAVMRVLATADPLERHDWPLAYARVREVASLNPHWRNVIIADRSTNQDVLSLGRPYSSDPLPLDATVIDHDAIAREGRGCPCLYLYQPIGADGRYELIVAIAPDTLRDLLMRHLPENSIAALVDRQGAFIARSQQQEERVATPATEFVRTAIASGETSGVYEGVTYEGFRNLSAYVVSPLTGWSTHVAIASALIERPRAYSSAAIIAGIVLALILAGVVIAWALRDIAQRRMAEQRMAQTQKLEAIGQLTGGVAHDFNNLLTVIIGGLNMLLKRIEDPKQREIAEHMLDAAKRGDKLTKQLLAFSRGKRMELVSIDLHQLAPGMEDLLRRSVGADVKIAFDLDPDARWVRSDANQLELAILNMVINARDAMPDGGSIIISTRASDTRDDFIALAVKDTGHGMPRDVVERAMEPFFTTKPAGKGTGLGLAQVFGVARQSGGDVEIESIPDRGATIRLLLPRIDPPRETNAESDAPATPAPRGNGQKILVVDDEAGVLDFVSQALRDSGFSVREAADPGAAMRILESETFDLLVTDYSMPAMTGLELVERALAKQPDIRLIIISGWADAETLEKSAARPRLLRKPFDENALLEAVRAAFAPHEVS